MKRCPKCNLSYSDKTLEFCLEDGTRLILENTFGGETPTVTRSNNPGSTTAKTIALPFSTPAENLNLHNPNAVVRDFSQKSLLKEKVLRQSLQILEIAPIIIALAHNWWQWIYLNNQYYSTLTVYILSANFLIWLLLLLTGAAVGLLSLRRVPNKGLAIVSLVILAINLILFLVPKH